MKNSSNSSNDSAGSAANPIDSPLTGYNVYVLAYQAMYEDFSADLDTLYSTKEKAAEAAAFRNGLSKKISASSTTVYEVYTLIDAVDQLKLAAQMRGEQNAKSSYSNFF